MSNGTGRMVVLTAIALCFLAGCREGQKQLGKDEFRVESGEAKDAVMFLLNEQGWAFHTIEVTSGDPEQDFEMWAEFHNGSEVTSQKLLSAYHFESGDGQQPPWPRMLAIAAYDPSRDRFRKDGSRELLVLVKKLVGGSTTTGEFKVDLPEGFYIGGTRITYNAIKKQDQALEVFRLTADRKDPPPGELANTNWYVSFKIRCTSKDDAQVN